MKRKQEAEAGCISFCRRRTILIRSLIDLAVETATDDEGEKRKSFFVNAAEIAAKTAADDAWARKPSISAADEGGALRRIKKKPFRNDVAIAVLSL